MPLNIAGTVVRSSFLAGLPNSGIVTRGLVLDIDASNIASYFCLVTHHCARFPVSVLHKLCADFEVRGNVKASNVIYAT